MATCCLGSPAPSSVCGCRPAAMCGHRCTTLCWHSAGLCRHPTGPYRRQGTCGCLPAATCGCGARPADFRHSSDPHTYARRDEGGGGRVLLLPPRCQQLDPQPPLPHGAVPVVPVVNQHTMATRRKSGFRVPSLYHARLSLRCTRPFVVPLPILIGGPLWRRNTLPSCRTTLETLSHAHIGLMWSLASGSSNTSLRLMGLWSGIKLVGFCAASHNGPTLTSTRLSARWSALSRGWSIRQLAVKNAGFEDPARPSRSPQRDSVLFLA